MGKAPWLSAEVSNNADRSRRKLMVKQLGEEVIAPEIYAFDKRKVDLHQLAITGLQPRMDTN
ncbi:hypothetical protein BGE01nite_35620 [Brevifollis gellanilyticus]|uniref:Uncharacterized protein n=1 Tax=Brevifollis gellanilyticus TaxID=748831 RepID=A0A512MD24_9BACT|nr:hypothetical protein BGE01nite_35620 [Brevifollis gellanilyticus]